jgi:flagellin
MSLGVLNNLAAVVAENNLNNTSGALNRTLQQLSSGSRINSGADDAAGLSLVDGLEANQQALAQSEANADEGVRLLEVADGALSQTTQLLNRAITLATEASNGTLNLAQDSAANQEYRSILSEISNIGSATTYNQNVVFNSTTGIYMGDSSTAGASLDNLTISALSSSNLGDTDGAISYTASSGGSGGSGGSGVSYAAGPGADTPMLDFDFGDVGGGIDQLSVDGEVGTTQDDQLTGNFTFDDDGAPESFTMGQTYDGTLVDSLATLATAIQAVDSAVTASAYTTNGGYVVLQSTDSLGLDSNTLQDVSPGGQAGTGTISGLASSDTLSGTLSIDVDGSANSITVNAANNDDTGATLATMIGNAIPGISAASYDSANGTIQITTTDTAAAADMTVDVSGLSNGSSSSGGSSSSATPASISYAASAGEDLSATDLLNAGDAQAALTDIDSAISDIAAQDGYVGSQINTLNAVSQVLSTQQENVQSAQNAIEATDYAQATSNLSKYEILSQTGIAALAQANSQQQEVTKLLQQGG